MIELAGVSVVRVKRFRGESGSGDSEEQDTYCSVAGRTNLVEKVEDQETTSSEYIFLKIIAQVVEVGESLGLEHREEVMLSKPEDEEVHKNK